MRPALLVCDLDNTLYDWVSYFVPSIYALIDKTVELIGCDRQALLDDLRRVHLKHHDSEHPFALLETSIVVEHFRGATRQKILEALNPAFHAFNSSRIRTLRVYPGVHEALRVLKSYGITLVAHTESKLYGVVDRLRRLDLAQYFSRIYCRERASSSHPGGNDNWLTGFPIEMVTELSHHQVKPDTSVLLEICSDFNIALNRAAYIGDSMTRDMLMAKNAGAFAIWAKYGTNHRPGDYEKLIRISHWSKSDIEREKKLAEDALAIKPDFVAYCAFSDILDTFELSDKVHLPTLDLTTNVSEL